MHLAGPTFVKARKSANPDDLKCVLVCGTFVEFGRASLHKTKLRSPSLRQRLATKDLNDHLLPFAC